MESKEHFEAYSYRTSARFGSRIRISVNGDTVSVIGPRVGRSMYRFWISIQVVLIALVFPTVVASIILKDGTYLGGVLILLIAHWFVGSFGAGCMWELENLIAFGKGTSGTKVSFPLTSVKRVRIGRGWARKGLWFILLPYINGLNKMSEGHCVSFEAPGGDKENGLVYALHMRTQEEAKKLAVCLKKTSL